MLLLRAGLLLSSSLLWGDEGRALLDIRLLTPIRSDKHQEGARIQAILMRPVTRQGQIRMPAGSLITGHVQRVHPVGLGIRREQAIVHAAFTAWQMEGFERPIQTRLVSIDNAREQVDRQGRIRGILAASNPMGLVRGFWLRPHPRLMMRGPMGLTGAVGTTWSRLALGPHGAAGLIGARLLLTQLPEPEIHLPRGAEMTLELLSAVPAQTWGSVPDPDPLDLALAHFLHEQPRTIRKPDGGRVADLINLVFLANQNTIEGAFQAAGWVPADALNRKSFSRAYTAFTRREGYATAPVSKLLYQTRAPDLVFQKSLNSIAKRHHIRLWRALGPGDQMIWLGAATHDVGVSFDHKRFSLTHRIDPNLDQERDKVLADLVFAQAVSRTMRFTAPAKCERGAITDGAIWIAVLRPTLSVWTGDAASTSPKGPLRTRAIRRVLLETRHYLLRENPYYLGYATSRSLRRVPSQSRLRQGCHSHP